MTRIACFVETNDCYFDSFLDIKIHEKATRKLFKRKQCPLLTISNAMSKRRLHTVNRFHEGTCRFSLFFFSSAMLIQLLLVVPLVSVCSEV